MITFISHAHFARQRSERRAAIAAAAVRTDRAGVWVDMEKLAPPQPAPVPRAQWPVWARAVARFAGKNDIGIGDVIHSRAGTAGKIYEWAYKAMAHEDCGCGDRRARLNARYPLQG